MRKVDAQYIVNLGRQILGKVCSNESRDVNRNLKEAGYEPVMDQGDIIDLKLSAQFPQQINKKVISPLFAYQDHELIEATRKRVKLMKATTLGKIIEFGLKPGEVCERTFRKTPYKVARIPLVGSEENGRELLEITALAVILAGVHDYCQIVERVRREQGTFAEVGRDYLSDKVTK